MMQQENIENTKYEDNIESTLRFCTQADVELKEIEERIMRKDRNEIFEYWNLKQY